MSASNGGRRTRPFVTVVLATLVLLSLASAASAAPPASTTPELILKAQLAGEISAATARRHLANAVLHPEDLPGRFVGRGEWEGTPVLSRLRRDLRTLPEEPRAELASVLAVEPTAHDSCEGSTAPAQFRVETDHFVIDFVTGAPGGGLTADDYARTLEQSWQREIEEFGWVAPPALPGSPDGKFLVRVDSATYGMLGYIGAMGTTAGEVGDHPGTAWQERHAWATCMVLRSTFGANREASLIALRSTAPHELAHAVQWGYGFADWLYDELYDQFTVFSEATATWTEDEVFDDVNRAHGWGMPDLQDSLDPHRTMWTGGSYGEEYKMWLPFRAITERFGSGVAGGSEQVFQNLFELIGGRDGQKLDPVVALDRAMGGSLPQAWNDAGLALFFMEGCRTGWKAPHCLEEAGLSAAARTPRVAQSAIPAVGGRVTGTVESRYAMEWIELPRSAAPLHVHLRNQSADDVLRLSVGCRTARGLDTQLHSSGLPVGVTPGKRRAVTLRGTDACLEAPVAVVTSAASQATAGRSAYELEALGGGA